MTRNFSVSLCVFLVLCGSAAAQPASYQDVVRNLRNPDPKVRVSAIRLLRESRYPQAAGPIAPLITDPINQVQLEAIAAELSFFLVEDIPETKKVAFFVEVRNAGPAAAAFELGPLAVWPHAVPPELVRALLEAVDDDDKKVRTEAIYTLGTIVRPPLAEDAVPQLIKALDHYDPGIRAAAARVAGRLEVKASADALITAMNDSNSGVRFAAMRALGAVREERAVQALTEQFNFYGKGEGAASALDALAKIADPASVALFKSQLSSKDPFLRRAAADGLGRTGDKTELSALQMAAGNDSSSMVRAAMAFALQKLGQHYIPRLVEFMSSARMAPQVAEYLIELGPSIVPELLPHLQDSNTAIRANVAQVLGVLGGPAATAALQSLAGDRDREVSQAATRAIERLNTPPR
ncbi:MAG: HEAT repeat domain-containing protein [Acidobacteriota bacterium]|nr:HEAT repeat domain-containing protein [Acidobacteriota bacterium]